jgi:Uma2 family endonuclease
MSTTLKATIEELYQVKGKAEIVGGEIVHMSPTGAAPGYAAAEVFVSLREYCRRTKFGLAVTDNATFKVNLPKRKTFSPDTALYTGKWTGMKFFEGSPVFAAEVRSEVDYGPRAEAAMAAKRGDYFAAGTLVVWDVDLLSAEVVKAYPVNEPDKPTSYRRGDIANAEPALPAWSMSVDDLFAGF